MQPTAEYYIRDIRERCEVAFEDESNPFNWVFFAHVAMEIRKYWLARGVDLMDYGPN